MPSFKAVFGPYNNSTESWGMKWMFNCVLMDGSMRGYTLRFAFDTRKFSVKPHVQPNAQAYAERMAEKIAALPQVQRGEVVEDARVTDILRDRLPPEHIARAAANAIRFRRR